MLWTVHHPELEEVWICSTKEKCIKFIEQNEDIWMKYKMDSELFKIHHAYVKDTELSKVIFSNMPELYL
jgi:hypothetical protein